MSKQDITPLPITQISIGYIGRSDMVTNAAFEPDDEALIFLNDDGEKTCHVQGANAKAMAAHIVTACNAYPAMKAALGQIAGGEFDYLKDAMNSARAALDEARSPREPL